MVCAGGNPGSTDWQTAFPVIARNVLLHYGELSHPLLQEIWPSLERFMAYLERLIEKSPELSNGPVSYTHLTLPTKA